MTLNANLTKEDNLTKFCHALTLVVNQSELLFCHGATRPSSQSELLFCHGATRPSMLGSPLAAPHYSQSVAQPRSDAAAGTRHTGAIRPSRRLRSARAGQLQWLQRRRPRHPGHFRLTLTRNTDCWTASGAMKGVLVTGKRTPEDMGTGGTGTCVGGPG